MFAERICPSRIIYVPCAIRILSRHTPTEGGPSYDVSNPLFVDKWMFGSRHIGWNRANHDLIISSCVRCCDQGVESPLTPVNRTVS